MLSPRDAFKVGFLGRCADQGMTPAQINATVKQAEDKLAGIMGDALKGGFGIAKGVAGGIAGGVTNAALNWGIPAAIVAPPLIGGTLGYGLAKATDIDDTDVDDIKDREVVDEYHRQADKLKRQQLVRRYQMLRRRSGRIFP